MTSPERIVPLRFPGEVDADPEEKLVDLCDEGRSRELKCLIFEHGAVLLRGFKVESVEVFREFVRTFSGNAFFDYAGGASPRHRTRAAGIYNSTDYAPEIQIPLHNELSYSDVYPEHLYFMCVTRAEGGEETTLGGGRRMLAAMDEAVVHELRRKGVCYIRNLSAERGAGYSWSEAFESNDRNTVEQICKQQGADLRWLPSGTLQLRQTRPATIRQPQTGEEV